MNFDANSLIASMIVGGIGFVAFAYGKKMQRFPQLLVGLVLMIFPNFISSVAAMMGICVALLGLLYFMVRLGW